MPRQIFLFSSIDRFSSRDVIQQLLELDKVSNEPITMFISSNGGVVMDMFSIIDAMEMVKSDIHTVVIGNAASAAAVIAAVGDKRFITQNSQIMIHEVWTALIGSSSELEDSLKQVSKFQDRLISILSKKTGQTKDKILADIKKTDKWFDAKQAVSYGLVDSVIKKEQMDSFKLSEAVAVQPMEINAITKERLNKIEILKSGVFEHPFYGKLPITKDSLNQLKDNFDNNVRGIDISFDYTHDNDSGESPAALWIKHLQVEQKGEGYALFAMVEFTPEGRKKVQEKAYKYVSPEFAMSYTDETGNSFPFVLLGGTLTNRPFIKGMEPIKLSEKMTRERKVNQMTKEELINQLKSEFSIDVENVMQENDSLKERISTMENKVRELSRLPAEKEEEVKNLKEQIKSMEEEVANKEKEAAFNELVKDGKVIPAQKDRILKLFDKAEDLEEFYKDSPKIVNTTPSGDDGNSDDALTDAELQAINSGEVTREDVLANRKV